MKKRSQEQVLAVVVGTYLLLSYIQRAVFLSWISLTAHEFPERLPVALVKGLLFDMGSAFYLFLPFTCALFLLPRRTWSRWPLIFLGAFPLMLACLAAFGECFFFDEFHARYNFIAVDYLVYTHEVIANVIESYSPALLLAGILLPTSVCAFLLFRLLSQLAPIRPRPHRAVAVTLVFAACALGVNEDALTAGEPYWTRELSKNSIFALFAAYRRNTIDFTQFYTTLAPPAASALTENWLTPQPTEPNLVRNIQSSSPEKKWNVVLVVMESMSAQYLAHFGNPQGITPNLDALADSGLFLTSLYATGTRTVRGLEALMLSLPPTPGQSILRRPDSHNMFNLGTVFRDRGYTTQFIYGGYAYFDNMRDWFESNKFDVVDRSGFPTEEVHFGNAWGVCDEDLFDQVLKQQTRLNSEKKNFFQVILTTSNHRPYTFPEGRIDMLPHTGREAAIKYSDFSIGRFLENARQTPWFDNTLFIFVADHDASVAGGTDIPVRDYLIPAIFYNPKLIPPQKFTTLASQIDLGPTLLGLMDFSYRSKFLGQDLFHSPSPRALLGTYQKVSLLQPRSLTVLAPNHSVETQDLDDSFKVKKSSLMVTRDASALSDSARLTVAIYQTASALFANGLLHADPGN